MCIRDRRLTAQKAQEKLIRVAKILKDQNIQFTLYIAGTGELHSELQTLIEELQLQEQVYLLGFVENMNAFMNSIDIFLLSSAWEGFGFVLVEAMLRAKPIVAVSYTHLRAHETVLDLVCRLLLEKKKKKNSKQKEPEVNNKYYPHTSK